MNSRGEQLEKHEIVKSLLSQHLNKNELATLKSQYEMYNMDFKAALEQAGYENEGP